MIQKFLITIFIIIIFLFGIRFLKKISLFKFRNIKDKKTYDDDVVDLEKDPHTNEYKPKKK